MPPGRFGIAAVRVLDALDVGVVVQDATSRVVYANAAAQRLLGVELHELLARDSRDPQWRVVRPDGTPFEPDALPVFEALRTGQPVRGVVLGVQRSPGGLVWLAVDAVPAAGIAGELAAVFVTLTDVTRPIAERLELQSQAAALDDELERTRRELDLSEATSQGVLRAMAEGVAVHGTQGEILFANPAAESILGLTLDQMRGRLPVDPTWRLTDSRGERLSPSAIPSEITRLTGRAQRNVVLGVDRATGGRRWLSVNTDPIGDAGPDGYCRVVATFTDITVQRQALAVAEAARDQLQRLTEGLPGAVLEVLVHADGREEVLFASRPLEDLFLVSVSAVVLDIGALWRCVAPGDRDRFAAAWRQAFAERGALEVEVGLVLADGTVRRARFRSGTPTEVERGVLFRVFVVDVTEQRQLERTLREAQRREAMGTLAAGIAHDFNNMLAAILPGLESLRAAVGADLRPDVEDAWQAATAASQLVRQMMLLTRREPGAGGDVVDLAEVADEVARMCRRTFDRRIDLVFERAAPAATVRASRAELQQVILNLCLNGRDALVDVPVPRLEIVVGVEGDEVVLSVADNGIGMSDETKSRLGEPFFTTKNPGHGTGLGVATVLGIVRDAGGAIRWRSRPGAGTRAEVRLPLHRQAGTTSAAAGDRAPPSRARGRVLLVDDEDLVRRALARTLARLGWQTEAVASGVEALRLLRSGAAVDVALIDRSMPGMSGEELLGHLRAGWPDLPVVVCSGFDGGNVPLDARTRLLAKPYAAEQLRAVLEELLG